MPYQLNLGLWNQVFAVPAAVVDDHLKLASGNYVKVLLLFLRHAGEEQSDAQLSETLGITPGEVEDALAYWQSVGVLRRYDCFFAPGDLQMNTHVQPDTPSNPPKRSSQSMQPDTPNTAQAEDETALSAKLTEQTAQTTQAAQAEQKTQAVQGDPTVQTIMPSLRRVLPPRPTPAEVSHRRQQSPELAQLFEMAEGVYGRLLTLVDLKDLCWFYDCLGLPADVILMLLHYCKKQDKTDSAYIAKAAVDWWSKDIIDHDRAEAFITRWEKGKRAQAAVRRVFGIGERRLTAKECEYITHWAEDLGYGETMVRLGYEESVNAIGQLKFSHINSILERWQAAGFKNAKQVAADKDAHLADRSERAQRAEKEKKPERAGRKNLRKSDLDLESMQGAFYNDLPLEMETEKSPAIKK